MTFLFVVLLFLFFACYQLLLPFFRNPFFFNQEKYHFYFLHLIDVSDT